jgi:hypothetical protein
MPDTRLILHVKGTEAETTELPKQMVRAAISQGQITHSQLIWSPSHNAWKQVREMPDLLPSQKLAPAPRPATSPKPLPKIILDTPNNPVARAAQAQGASPTPRIATASGSTPKVRAAGSPAVAAKAKFGTGTPVAAATTGKLQVRVPAKASSGSFVEEHKDDFHIVKWVCIGLGALLAVIILLNYLLVDEPLVSGMGKTSYADVSEYGHLGAFLQPNIMVIHIPASAKLTSDNMSDYLSALARSTPRNPITGNLYERIALTSGWTAQYSFSGYNWKELGQMANQDSDQRKDFILSQMNDAGGGSLLPATTLSQDAQQSRRDNVWNTFVAHFSANP